MRQNRTGQKIPLLPVASDVQDLLAVLSCPQVSVRTCVCVCEREREREQSDA